MRLGRVALGVAVLAGGVAAVLLIYHPRFSHAQQGSPQAAGALPAAPAVPQALYAVPWRVDNGFVSTIQIKNVLVVGPLDVTPVLYMADGTEYDLHSVHLAIAGVAEISVNDALASAPASVAGHASVYGSAALRWQYLSPGHVVATMQVLNVPASLSYTYSFNFIDPAASGPQHVEGLWWRRDRDVGGFVTVANMTGSPESVSLQALGAHGTALPPESMNLAPHAAQLIDLNEFTEALPAGENQAGGLRVQYTGNFGDVMVGGGLEDNREGYSANLPFCSHPMAPAKPAHYTFASTGLMVGAPDPMMGFPNGTRFTPYAVLRNTTPAPLAITPRLNYVAGGEPTSRKLAPIVLAPLETRQLDLATVLRSLGLGSFSGSLNVAFSFHGHVGDAMVATGSVDQTGTYVFEVEPEGVGPASSKISSYWTTANGWDTMFSLWNPGKQAEDIVVIFYYADGSGNYKLPVHLAARGSTTIDMAMLIMSQQPDAAGRVIPASEQLGSAELENAKGNTTMVNLAISVGTFNVLAGTCCTNKVNCCAYSNFQIAPANDSSLINTSMQCTAKATNCDGAIYNFNGDVTSWSSSNTSVATITSSGVMTGIALGSVTISATFSPTSDITSQICPPQTCPMGSHSGSTNENIDSLVFTVTSGGAPNDGQGVIAKNPFNLKIQAKSPSGTVPDPSFSGSGSLTVSGLNTSIGESAPSSVSFSSGTANATITLVSASGSSSSPSSIRSISVASSSSKNTFQAHLYWKVMMDVELWQNCGFISCPNKGSYYCQTACDGGGFAQKTQFVALTSKLCNAGIILEAQPSGGGWSGLASTTQQDVGPTTGNAYWFTGSIPSMGGCLSDALAGALGVKNGCSGGAAYGQAMVVWRFNQ